MKSIFAGLLLLGAFPCVAEKIARPNVIVILADDLGYGDLGCYGQKLIATPNLDQLARDGMRFTDFYAGATVCAPSRCTLMTGKNNGCASVRGNNSQQPPSLQGLQAGERTVAHVFKDAGYATALFGKWGLGEIGSAGHPNRMGFDEFFGYLSQTHAHNYYPEFLIHNRERVPLPNVLASGNTNRGDGWAREKKEYAPERIFNETLKWVASHKNGPFFLYYAPTLPHANNEGARGTGNGQEIPDHGIYKDKLWPDPDKGQAAMISYLDAQIGELRARLSALGVATNTLIIFTSDNGPHREGGNHPEFFNASGPLRGLKRALYDGGIRVPFIAAWPGTIKAGKVSEHIGYGGDLFATVGELTGQNTPAGLDSVSFLPTLTGRKRKQATHDRLYWEFYEQGGSQAVRFGKWKAVRQPMFTGEIELYDLTRDIGETNNVAVKHPKIVAQAADKLNAAHVPDPVWVVTPKSAGK